MAWFMGIDIGSRTSKGVITRDGVQAYSHIVLSGTNYRIASSRLIKELLSQAGLNLNDIQRTAATGQGSANVDLASRHITDILACARGISRTLPLARTVIDIQAQSSHVLRLNSSGQVTNFVVSEKCAAGSGRFMEIIANVLQINLEDIGPLSQKANNPVSFSTSCAVFGESEAISRVAEGAAKEDILAGVHQALANKISALLSRVSLEPDYAVSGGGALNTGLIRSLEEKLKVRLLIPPQPQIINAFGAAIIAQEGEDMPAASRTPRLENLGGEL